MDKCNECYYRKYPVNRAAPAASVLHLDNTICLFLSGSSDKALVQIREKSGVKAAIVDMPEWCPMRSEDEK